MREVSIFLFAMAAVVVLVTLAAEIPSSKTWRGGLITAAVIALFALASMILSGRIPWYELSPWGPVLIFGGPAAVLPWVSAQDDHFSPPLRDPLETTRTTGSADNPL
jgi:hypothetical protein